MSVLRAGCTGPEVVGLQDRLRTLGLCTAASDGNFGPVTEVAVIAFQRSHELQPDGVVGAATAAALGLTAPPPIACAIPAVTVAMVCQMLPATPRQNIETHLPAVLNALVESQLADKCMVLMALATIRAETEAFLPLSEGQSRFNTSPGGHPFDLYDSRADLGNQGAPDGERFRGRGFVQLTGRSNYQVHGQRIGLGDGLIENPDLANDPEIAAKLLASFLASREAEIRAATAANDLAKARRLVNGGSNGLDRFSEAFRTGTSLIPEALITAATAGGSV